MLKYKYIKPFFLSIILLLLFLYFYNQYFPDYFFFNHDIRLIHIIIPLLIFLIILFFGSAFIRLNFYLNSICKSYEKNTNDVFISFDDSPNNDTTPLILDILEKHGVKATFFIIGNKAEKNLALVKEIANKGHILGNHSYSHSNFFPLKSKSKVIKEIQKTDSIIKKINPKELNLFRPPFGVTNPIIATSVKNTNYKTIGWSLRSLDTIIKKPEKLLKRLYNKTKGGDIILLHDNSISHCILEKYIVFLKKNNYNLRTIDKLINDSHE